MDNLDTRLISELQKNPRQSNVKLARLLGVSEATVRRRVSDLISSGAIRLTAIPDLSKSGYETIAFIALQVELSQIGTVAARLAQNSHVHYAALCTGSHDIMVWVVFTSSEELSNFITSTLAEIPGIVRSETMIQLKQLKGMMGWLQLSNSVPKRQP